MKSTAGKIQRSLAALNAVARNRRGNALAVTAAALPILVGAMGLGVDFTQWVVWKRNLQGAADSAAIAGAQSLAAGASWANVQADATRLINVNASSAAIPRSQTLINRILTPGQVLGAGQTAATHGSSIEVVLESQGRLYFAGLFLANQPTIRARAVAGPRGAGNKCFMALSPTAEKALWIKGNPSVSASCGFQSNSNHTNSLYLEGNASLNASTATAVGGVNKEGSSTWNSTVREPNSAALADPYGPSGRNLQEPVCTTWKNVTEGTGSTYFWDKDNDTPHTSAPGCYNVPNGGDVQFDGNGKVKLATGGVYVFKGQGIIKIDGNIDVDGAGVSIVLMDGARLEVNGTVNLNLSAMTTAQADAAHPTDANRRGLAGILIWQTDASVPADKNNFITGNASNQLKGAIYTPHQGFEFRGNMGSSECLQLVAKTILIEGNSGVTNNCPTGDPNYANFGLGQIYLAE